MHTDERNLLAVLAKVSPKLRARLLAMIEQEAAYFVLSGSDPREANGCCPSNEVGEANGLVEAGILCRHHPESHPEACTAAVYAPAGEMIATGAAAPRFERNDQFRKNLADVLTKLKDGKPSASVRRRWVMGAVVLLIVLGLAAALQESMPLRRAAEDEHLLVSFVRGISAPAQPEGTLLIFFQAPNRCPACRDILETSGRVLQEHFTDETAAGRVAFRTVDLADERYAHLRRAPELILSTLAVVYYAQSRPVEMKMLTDEVWRLYRDEQEFETMLIRMLQR